MEHDLELIIARLEILEIEVCNIIHNPGNIGKQTFSIFWTPGNIGNICIFFHVPDILEILEILFFLIFRIFTKKTRAEISRRMVQFSCRDLSYETDSGPKTKTVSDPNFQVTPTTAMATRRQLSHLARPLDHHAQGPNIPFGAIPRFDVQGPLNLKNT